MPKAHPVLTLSLPTPIGRLHMAATDREVIRIELPHANAEMRLKIWVALHFPHASIRSGVSPILKDWKGLQPFMRFVRNGQANLVAASLQNSAELREHDKLLRDGMYWAVRNAHPDVVQVMLNYNHWFHRIEEVEALVEWVKIPPATESDKKEVFRLFTEYFSGK